MRAAPASASPPVATSAALLSTLSLKGADTWVYLQTIRGRKLHMSTSDSGGNMSIGSASNGDWSLTQNSNARMTLTTGGSINIGAKVFIGSTGNSNPATTALDVSGSLRIRTGAESYDASRTGAIKYEAGAFYVCQNTATGWENLATGTGSSGDRIISGTTQIIAYNNTSATIATAGVERVVVGTDGNVGMASSPTATNWPSTARQRSTPTCLQLASVPTAVSTARRPPRSSPLAIMMPESSSQLLPLWLSLRPAPKPCASPPTAASASAPAHRSALSMYREA